MGKHWIAWVIIGIMGLVISANGAELLEEIILMGGMSSMPGARASGLGGAYIAVADDYTASYWNPAGLAQIRRIELYGALSQRNYRDRTTYFGNDTEASSNFTKLSSFGVVFPAPVYRGALTFALGYNLVRDWDRTSSFNDPDSLGSSTAIWKQADELENGRLGFWSLGLAMDVSPSVSVGGGLQYWIGRDDYSITGQRWGSSASSDEQDIFTTLHGWRGDMGVLIRAGSVGRLGMVIETPIVYNAKEDWAATGYGSGSWVYRIGEPFTVRGGGSVSVGRFLAAMDVDWMDWSQIAYKSEPPFPGYSSTTANIAIRRDFRSTLGVHGGIEALLPLYGIRLRGGGGFEPNPEKGSKTENGQTSVSGGLGVLLDESIMLDLSYDTRWWKQQTSLLNEDITSQRLQLSIAYRF
jgi:hypothetical protein